MTAVPTVTETTFDDLPLLYRGKVRDIYQVDNDKLLLVATDRLSAFDCVLPTPIRYKGAVLTALSEFWFGRLGHITKNHLITADFEKMPEVVRRHAELRGRSMLVKKAKVFPVECVVRGYLEGSGWKDYKEKGKVCGYDLPRGLQQCDRLLEPLFTPSTKAESGHDENITGLECAKILGPESAAMLKSASLKLYKAAAEFARTRGIIIADTKFEFGVDEKGNLLLVDEVVTPDSSRFWALDTYEPGHPQPSFDKQFVREYLESLDWDKRPPAPALPDDIAAATTERYLRAYKLLTGKELPGV
jgi:phosphoribosylaminoimidazole-succinocarboxamide synthase